MSVRLCVSVRVFRAGVWTGSSCVQACRRQERGKGQLAKLQGRGPSVSSDGPSRGVVTSEGMLQLRG